MRYQDKNLTPDAFREYREHKPLHRTPSDSGFILITNMLILTLLTLLSVTILRMAALEEKMAGNQKLLTNAQLSGERGISEAIDDLLSVSINDTGSETDINWEVKKPGPSDTDYYDPNKSTYSGASDNYGFNYSVSHKVVAGAVATDPDGDPYYQINATGISGAATRSMEVAVSLVRTSTWKTGLVGCSGIQFDSTTSTGSYSSSGLAFTGDKGDVKTIEAPGHVSLNSNVLINGKLEAYGDLTMNSSSIILKDAMANGAISLNSNACIGSDAYSNAGITNITASGTCDTSFGGSPSGILGTRHQNQSATVVETEPCDPLDVDAQVSAHASIATSNDNSTYGAGNNYFESSDSLNLGTSGSSTEFYFTQLSMKDGTVTINGDVTFYVDGNFHLLGTQQLNFAANATLTVYMTGGFKMDSNAVANLNGITDRFSLYSNASDSGDETDIANSSMILNSNSGFWGLVYAPKAYVYVDSNSVLRGAVRGKYLYTSSNFDFDYDEDLENSPVGATPTDYKLVYWTE